jgi:hypothetical protein
MGKVSAVSVQPLNVANTTSSKAGPHARRFPENMNSARPYLLLSDDEIYCGGARRPRRPRSRPCARRDQGTSASEAGAGGLLSEGDD